MERKKYIKMGGGGGGGGNGEKKKKKKCMNSYISNKVILETSVVFQPLPVQHTCS